MAENTTIDEVLARSIDTIYPSKQSLKEVLESEKKLRIYVGIDPTADYVHLGHSTNYLILKRFWDMGHKIIVLIGDFTAMIGDPSDKSALRKRLTKEDVLKNLETFKSQIGKILDFDSKENPIEFRFNSEWLSKLTFEDSVELASYFTVQQMIERDAFQKRLAAEKPLYVHEFFYPLMQGYDSVALEADLEIGGTDQTFNMLAGRTLVKGYQNREKFVITTTLLENPVTGEKLMSKSLGTGVGLNEEPFTMYQKIMRLPDEGIVQCFIDCTYVSMSAIEAIKKELEDGANPRDIKMHFAHIIVAMYHSEKDADAAQENFVKAFQQNEIPDIEKSISIGNRTLDTLLVEEEIVSSKSDARRLAEGDAIFHFESEKTISAEDLKQTPRAGTYRIGKSRFIKIV